jgi:hypothetical protein
MGLHGLLEGYLHFSFSLALKPPWAPASNCQFHDRFIEGRTPWTCDQPVARPLPKHRTTQTQNKHIHIPNIHAFYGIRTCDPGFRESEDSACLRPLGYRGRQCIRIIYKNSVRTSQETDSNLRSRFPRERRQYIP